MRVLITGGAGFIGSHIAERCLARGDAVTVIDTLLTGRRENVPADARFIEFDISANLWTRMWGEWRPDVIYHCAASYADRDAWERDARTNVLGTINVVRLAQETGARIVYLQTSLCYGLNPRSPIRPDAPLAPCGSYAVSKTAGERYIADSGVPFVSLRLANMYGPRNLSGPVPAFYRAISEGRTPTIVDTRRDFVFVDDLVELVMGLGDETGVYHAGSGFDQSVLDVYRAVSIAMGREPEDIPLTPRKPDDAPTILLDASETERTFGWRARMPLSIGIERAVRWYSEHGVERTYTHLAVGASR